MKRSRSECYLYLLQSKAGRSVGSKQFYLAQIQNLVCNEIEIDDKILDGILL